MQCGEIIKPTARPSRQIKGSMAASKLSATCSPGKHIHMHQRKAVGDLHSCNQGETLQQIVDVGQQYDPHQSDQRQPEQYTVSGFLTAHPAESRLPIHGEKHKRADIHTQRRLLGQ